mgnify:CR=1 FL=1
MTENSEAILTGADPAEVWPLVRDHHYSGRMPGSIQRCYALREPGGLFGDTGEVIAAIVFSSPPTRWSEPVLELSRLVRVPGCDFPLTKLISGACKYLKINGYDLAVSFADWTQNHHGGIYQAASWNFTGKRDRANDGVLVDGVFIPGRSCNAKWGTRSPEKLKSRLTGHSVEAHYDEGKFLYWRALSKAEKKKADRLGLECLPYPKPRTA